MKLFGLEFKPMTSAEWDGYAGAEPGTLICHPSDDTDLLFDPATGRLSEIVHTEHKDGSNDFYQRDWQSEMVVGDLPDESEAK